MYQTAVKNSVLDYLKENFSREELAERMQDREQFAEELNDELWAEDSVTGNASGSYTFSRWGARKCCLEDMDTVTEALREFCVDAETIAEKFLDEDWEYFDVSARCYVLCGAICEALNEIAAEVA